MLNKIFQYQKSISLLMGIISVYALPPFYVFPVLFISLSSLLLLINKADNAKKSFAIGYWFGFGYFAVSLSWIGNALLIDASTFGWLYPITLLACGAFFGLFIGLPAWCCFKLKNIYAQGLALASFWVLSEWLRSFFLTGFPWNLIGSTLAFSTITMQLAAVFGTYGLSLIVLLVTIAPAYLIKKRNLNSLIITFGTIFFLSLVTIGYGYYHLKNYNLGAKSNVNIRMVQPSIPQDMKWGKDSLEKNLDEYIKLSQQNGLDNIDFVIWGETASAFALDMDKEHMDKVRHAIPNNGYLITGLVRYEYNSYGNYRPLNSMFVINKEGTIEDYYDKSHLVPFGEYIPLREYLPNWIRPVANAIGNFKAGEGPKVIKIANYPSLSGLICYEIIFPGEIITKAQRPQWIINLTNDGWYGDSQGPYQHLVTTQLRAIEEGITIVRVANTGVSALISPIGQILGKISLNKKGILDVSLPENLNISTFYGKYGNLLIILLCIVNISISCYISLKDK